MSSGARLSSRSNESCARAPRFISTGALGESGATTGGTSVVMTFQSPGLPLPVRALRNPLGVSPVRVSLKSNLRSAANATEAPNSNGNNPRNIGRERNKRPRHDKLRDLLVISNSTGNGIAHLTRARAPRGRIGRIENIAGAQAGIDGLGHREIDGRRLVIQTETVAKHERRRENLRDGVREVFSGNVRGRAARGFVEAEGMFTAGRAQACAGQ